jgi:acetyltransferase-like isoleucine patch superfamily enzyme
MKKLNFVIRYLIHKAFSKFQHLGWKVIFENNVTVRGAEYMCLRNNVNIDSNAVLYVIKHPKYNSKTPRLILEDGVGIGIGAVILVINSVHIKKDAMIGPNCVIADYDHSYQDINIPIHHQGLGNIKPIEIGEGAWIGANATIVSGVTIGKNVVIGANSVVTKDIPDYSVAIGIPAKVIKKYNHKTNTWQLVKTFKD